MKKEQPKLKKIKCRICRQITRRYPSARFCLDCSYKIVARGPRYRAKLTKLKRAEIRTRASTVHPQ